MHENWRRCHENLYGYLPTRFSASTGLVSACFMFLKTVALADFPYLCSACAEIVLKIYGIRSMDGNYFSRGVESAVSLCAFGVVTMILYALPAIEARQGFERLEENGES